MSPGKIRKQFIAAMIAGPRIKHKQDLNKEEKQDKQRSFISNGPHGENGGHGYEDYGVH